jgi:methyl-accepting chemotaxis protein
MKIGLRLKLCFGTILVVILALSAFTLNRLAYTNSRVKVISDDYWPKSVLLNGILDTISNTAITMRNTIILENPDDLKRELSVIPERTRMTAEKFKNLDKTITDPDEKAFLKAVIDKRNAYKSIQKNLMELVLANRKKEAREFLVRTYQPAQIAYTDAIRQMIAFQEKQLRKSSDDAEINYHQTLILSVIFSAVAILLSILFAFFVTRSITKPIEELVSINDRIADGDLTVTIALESKDEVGKLADSSRKLVNRMREVLTRVAETSGLVASASLLLQATAGKIANGTEEAAAQTGTVATASEEMAATSGDIALNCNKAVESSRRTSDSATRGGMVVQETIKGMARIADSVKQSAKTVVNLGARSEQIGQIVGTIEDIADQTNLLALNAAIEAARAGEQGRGFAVVADEVRRLAERTTKATKEISDMIKNIQNETKEAVRVMNEGVGEVEKGAASSEKSGQALEEILEQIDELTMQINQIATAAEEQTATTNEIATNVNRMTSVVQETARGASETATASVQLSGNAKLLQEQVSKFKLA